MRADEASCSSALPSVMLKPVASKMARKPFTLHMTTFCATTKGYKGKRNTWCRKLVRAVMGIVLMAWKLLSMVCAPPCRKTTAEWPTCSTLLMAEVKMEMKCALESLAVQM